MGYSADWWPQLTMQCQRGNQIAKDSITSLHHKTKIHWIVKHCLTEVQEEWEDLWKNSFSEILKFYLSYIINSFTLKSWRFLQKINFTKQSNCFRHNKWVISISTIEICIFLSPNSLDRPSWKEKKIWRNPPYWHTSHAAKTGLDVVDQQIVFDWHEMINGFLKTQAME